MTLRTRRQDADVAGANEHGQGPICDSMTAISAATWHRILDELRRSDAGLIRAWLYELDAPELVGGVMAIRARNEAQLRHLERCRTSLAGCAQVGLDRLVSLDLRLGAERGTLTAGSSDPIEATLRPEFTLDQFVVGPENQLAHAAALRFLDQAGAECNPLFFHGPAGAGKSHLLQAMCTFWNSNENPPVSFPIKEGGIARYMTAARFVAEFTEACETSGPNHFRERFGRADLVALDEIEFFTHTSRCQEELFHVVNGLLAAGRRLVLAADRPPASIPNMEPRLTSRFSGGMVIAMDSPSVETRLRIIEQKNRLEAYEFPQEALRQIAERSPARDLDRVLARLNELAQGCRGSLTMDLVSEVFRTQSGETVFA